MDVIQTKRIFMSLILNFIKEIYSYKNIIST